MIRKTRYPELGYEQQGPGLWRIVALPEGSAVGPQYASREELLGDLNRYARVYGVECGPGIPYSIADFRYALDRIGPLAGFGPRELLLYLCDALEKAGIFI